MPSAEGPFSIVGFPSTPGTQLIKASSKFKVPKVPKPTKQTTPKLKIPKAPREPARLY